ncbi:MAG: hypothetical protein PHG06_09455 [Parabacteroides sp.]|nr:hypothetical protein [Parabacteroides sp.]
MVAIYDDKTQGVIESNGYFILPSFNDHTDATFKASYIVASNIECTGKIIALFNLIVLGDVKASEIDVKGKFVCTGKCDVEGSIVVQNNIWVEAIRAKIIETHDQIIAQEIDAEQVKADGSIIVGKTFFISDAAESYKNILCGETVYGAGKVVAQAVFTAEPIDLDGGDVAVSTPNSSSNSENALCDIPPTEEELIELGEKEFAPRNDYCGFLDAAISKTYNNYDKQRFTQWRNVLSEAERVIQTEKITCTDVAILIRLAEIADSDYFRNWDKIDELFYTLDSHFTELVRTFKESVTCVIGSYPEWLQILDILCRYGDIISEIVYDLAFELIVSNLGLKAKFVTERLFEKGWNVHG